MPEREKVKLEYCPKCKLRCLFWNQAMQIWECLNPECRHTFTSEELSEYSHSQQSKRSKQVKQSKQSTPRQVAQKKETQQVSFDAPLWVVNILESKRVWSLLICLAVIWWCWTGMGVQYSSDIFWKAIGIAFPVILLYIIKLLLRKYLNNYKELAKQHSISSLFYSIRKSSLLRLIIILLIITLLITTIWSIYSLVFKFQQNSLFHSLNLIVLIAAQIWLLSWLCGTLKHSRQLSSKPKFAVVFWSLLAVAVFCAFVGISPFSDIKDTAASLISDWLEQTTPPAKIVEPPPVQPPAERSTIPPKTSDEVPSPPPPAIGYETNIERYPNRVWVNEDTYLVSGTGRATELYENPNAKNPTWDQLLSFLRTDNTDKITYVPNYFVCIDFAETLHNNAEGAEIRCGLVVLYGIEHACNAFQTDKGLVFIDDTGTGSYQPVPYEDKNVDVQIGTRYIPRYLFPQGNPIWLSSMGIVSRYQICWEAGKVLAYQYEDSSIAYIPPSYVPPSYVPPSYCEKRCANHHGQWHDKCIDDCMKETESIPAPPSDCEERCAKYQGIWHNGCIDDCMKGTESWSWK